ncbi:hypothetical protein YERSI8AC_190118 [Enterobacterales bacterium 8AC]|nr:hypothetical protein YERSI8AC_190118 [Enterobacterales bacterium 8AC]
MVAPDAGAIVSAAKTTEDKLIAAATVRANNFFIVDPSNYGLCFNPSAGLLKESYAMSGILSVSDWFQLVT